MAEPSRPGGEASGVTRHQMEVVLRRATELATANVDSEDRLSEGELIRIAGEVGLPARYVRQALYELQADARATWSDRRLGAAVIVASRAVPGAPGDVLDRFADYFSAEEYLRLVRRREGRASFAPAEDLLSKVGRAFRRGAGEHALARARGVSLTVRSLGDEVAGAGEQAGDAGAREGGPDTGAVQPPLERSHLRIDVDLSDRRRAALATGIGIGAAGGAVAGSALAVGIGIATGATFPDPVAFFGVLGLGATLGAAGGLGVGMAAARAWFRNLKAGFRNEAEGLLDRAERGDRLTGEAPAWRRRLDRALNPRTSRE